MKNNRILLLENNENDAKYAIRYLSTDGYEVFRAINYVDATNLIKEIKFDVAVIDLYLPYEKPERDQPGGLLFINNELHNNKIPAIIWTLYPSVNLVKRALKRGSDGTPAAIDFVSKEDDLSVLSDAIKKVLKEVNKGKQRIIKTLVGVLTVVLILILLILKKDMQEIIFGVIVGVIANIITWVLLKRL